MRKRLAVGATALFIGVVSAVTLTADNESAKTRPCNKRHPCTTTTTTPTTSSTTTTSSSTTTTPPPPVGESALGVYEGAARPSAVDSFATWLGRPVDQVLDFIPRAVNGVPSWAKVDNPTYWTSAWANKPYLVAYSLPLTIQGTSLVSVANGCCDSHFRSFAQNLLNYGQGDSIVRLGWEFNGSWYPWAANGNVQAFKDAFVRISGVLKSVAPNLKIAWCRTRGGFDVATPGVAYPGDAAVDIISLDSYDNKSNSDPAARWAAEKTEMDTFAAFAAQHPSEAFGIDEWGLVTGDSTIFIDGMANWFIANNVDYQMVFDYAQWDLDNFPNAKARYKARFTP